MVCHATSLDKLPNLPQLRKDMHIEEWLWQPFSFLPSAPDPSHAIVDWTKGEHQIQGQPNYCLVSSQWCGWKIIIFKMIYIRQPLSLMLPWRMWTETHCKNAITCGNQSWKKVQRKAQNLTKGNYRGKKEQILSPGNGEALHWRPWTPLQGPRGGPRFRFSFTSCLCKASTSYLHSKISWIKFRAL